MSKVNSHLRIGCRNDRTYVGDNPAKDCSTNVATLFNPMSISLNLPLFTRTITLGRLIKTQWLPNKHYPPRCLVILAPKVTPTSNMPHPLAPQVEDIVLLLLFGHHRQLLGTLTWPHCLLLIDNMQTSCVFILPHYSRIEEKS